MKATFSLARLVTVFALTFSVASLKADIIELVNGDHYRGTVISMTPSNIEFMSEIQGKVHLPREKVAQITFREAMLKTVPKTNAPIAAVGAPIIMSGPTAAPAPAIPAAASSPVTADAVVQQMRQQGIQPQLINQVQQQIFGKASPEAASKFDEIMSGLMSGKTSVQDLRVQAQTAVQQARQAKKDLGGDAGEMLDGYIAILEKFVNETTPGSTVNDATPPTK